jgi:hypothetical protein
MMNLTEARNLARRVSQGATNVNSAALWEAWTALDAAQGTAAEQTGDIARKDWLFDLIRRNA